MHLSAAIFVGGGDTYWGMVRNLVTLVAEIWAQDGGIGLPMYFRSKIPCERPAGFLVPPPYWRWSYKHC